MITGFAPPGFERWFEKVGYDATLPGAYESSISGESVRRISDGSEQYQMILVPDPGTDAA